MAKLSVIIPTYKAKETIAQTLHSIAMQSIVNDIEVVIVNDCDGLNYDSIIDTARFGDLNIRYITRDKNGGCGAARNTGVKNASADYVMFIDADDCFAGCLALEILYNKITASNADMIISTFESETRDEKGIYMRKMSHSPTWMHGKIIRKAFMLENNLFFNESLRLNEDAEFNQLFMDMGGKVEELDSLKSYTWRENTKSVTHQSRYNNKYVFVKACTEYIKDSAKYKIEAERLKHRVCQNVCVIYQYACIVLDDYPDKFDEFISACQDYWKLCAPIMEGVTDQYITDRFAHIMKGFEIIPDMTFREFINKIKN